MRIAVVTETYPPEVNGVAKTIGHLVEGLRDRGHDLQIIRPKQASDKNGSLEDDTLAVRGYVIPWYPEMKFGAPCRRRLKSIWEIWKPEVVHIVTEGPLGWSAISAARSLGIPVISDYHTHFDAYSRHYGLRFAMPWVTRYLRWIHNRTQVTLVPTQQLCGILHESGYRRVGVVGRGIDGVAFSPHHRSSELRASWGLQEGDLAVVYVGRVAPEKNIELAVRGFEQMRNATPRSRFIVVGDGPCRADLQDRFPEHLYAGRRIGEDLSRFFASGDVFLFPSETETFGNVVLEAMSSGLAVVAYDHAAARELIHDGQNGFLVPFADEAAFLRQCEHIAQRPDLVNEVGRLARITANRHDWGAVVSDLELVMTGLQGGRSNG